MQKLLSSFLVILALMLTACSTDDARQATLLSDVKPPLRYNPRKVPQKTSSTDEQIRLLKAQTDAKARLAEIEARKTERLKKLETERAIAAARIKAETAQTVKNIELKQAQSTNTANARIAAAKAQADIAAEKERQKTALARQQEEIAFYRQILIAGVALLFLLMLLIYLLYRHRQSLKLKLHEDQLRQQAWLESSRQHHEKVTKLLEIIADEGVDKGVKKELTKLLKDQDQGAVKLLE